MPPTPPEPIQPKPAPIDPKDLLLPKKDTGPSILSATRASAGELAAQEAAATLPTTTAPEIPLPAPQSDDSIKPLQTYKADIESVVSKGASVVSIAAAEENRRAQQAPSRLAETLPSIGKVVAGVALMGFAIASVVGVIWYRGQSVPAPATPIAPFITVDEQTSISLEDIKDRNDLMYRLVAAKNAVSLSLGLISWIYFGEPEFGNQASLSDALQFLSPNAPGEILRTVTGDYMLGIHSFDENQPFLIFQVDSYEVAYAGMLAWEETLYTDLQPFFKRTPSPAVVAPNVVIESPIASSSATSTNVSTSSEPVTEAPRPFQRFIPTNFTDKVVENRDTRAVMNEAGDILFLWTFLSRNTILITTNEYTLREILSRLTVTPLTPQPR